MLLQDRLGLVASVQLAGEIGLTMPRGALIGIITHATGGNENQADTDMDEIAGSLRQTEITAPVRDSRFDRTAERCFRSSLQFFVI